MMKNIYAFLIEHEETIQRIPELVGRLDALESQVGILEQGDYDEPVSEVTRPEIDETALAIDSGEFDPDDHDELFADGGETLGSFDVDDWSELFGTASRSDPLATDPV